MSTESVMPLNIDFYSIRHIHLQTHSQLRVYQAFDGFILNLLCLQEKRPPWIHLQCRVNVRWPSAIPGVRPGGDLRSVGVSISCFNFGVSSLSKDDSEFSVPLKSFRFLKGRNPRSAHCQVAVLAQKRAKSAEFIPDKPTRDVCPGPGARPPRSR